MRRSRRGPPVLDMADSRAGGQPAAAPRRRRPPPRPPPQRPRGGARGGGGGARRRLWSAQPSQISIDCPPCTCTCRPELAPFSSHGSAMSDMHVKIDLSCSAWVPTVYTIELRRQMDS
jgi:hypothetical protein